MSGKTIDQMGDSELLREAVTDLKWIKEKLHQVCQEVYVRHDQRIKDLEKHEAEQKAIQNERKDKTALIIAVAAIMLSTVNILGGN